MVLGRIDYVSYFGEASLHSPVSLICILCYLTTFVVSIKSDCLSRMWLGDEADPRPFAILW